MKIRIIVSIILLGILYLESNSQNLVVNPGFETFSNCPENGFYEIHLCDGWSDPAGSADYFNLCMHPNADVGDSLKLFYGKQVPHNGSGFAGFFLLSGRDYYDREYLQTQFAEPLRVDTRYHVNLYISLGSYSEIYSDVISFCFSEISHFDFEGTNPEYPNPSELRGKHGVTLICTDRVTFKRNKALQSKSWTLLDFYYSAKGGEKYLTMGIFKDDISMKEFGKTVKKNINDIRNRSKLAYYYIDDLSLVESNEKPDFVHKTEY